MRRMYSVSELKTYIEQILKSGVDINADVINANVVLQKPRYEFDFELPDYNGFTKKQWYTKVIILGNELHIIGNAYYLNTGESTAGQRFTSFTLTIPSEIGQFIYDAGGKNLTEEPIVGEQYIRSGFVSNTSGVSNVHSLRIQHAGQNQLSIYEVDVSNVPAGDKIVKGFHITLILAE